MLHISSSSYSCPSHLSKPFQGLNAGIFLDSGAEFLELIDGGSNLENIPLGPLFVNARKLDVIVAVDASADQGAWPKYVCPLIFHLYLMVDPLDQRNRYGILLAAV